MTRRDILSLPFLRFETSEGGRPAAGKVYRFHHDHVLGTSLELVVVASCSAEADEAERALFREIERLRQVLSTYDAKTEISRLNASQGTFRCSQDLFAVLSAYDCWSARTGGAISAALSPGEPVRVNYRDGIVSRRLRAGLLNVDALGKAYILDRAALAARRAHGVTAVLLNIGGDVVVSGAEPRRIGIADPACPHENGALLGCVTLKNGAVATSGGYERQVAIGGRSFSHIRDPRTGEPADSGRSATVIARDSVTANALSTALCVLEPSEGLRLVGRTPNAECLLITADGTEYHSPGFPGYRLRGLRPVSTPAGWPAGYAVSITLTLKMTENRPMRRPYVAIWAEDSKGNCVRTIALWTSARNRWLPDLHAWYAANHQSEPESVSRATRPPGRYRLAWDGLDDRGRPVPAGTYRITVETNRQDGDYNKQSGLLLCDGTKRGAITLKETSEFEAVAVEYAVQGSKA